MDGSGGRWWFVLVAVAVVVVVVIVAAQAAGRPGVRRRREHRGRSGRCAQGRKGGVCRAPRADLRARRGWRASVDALRVKGKGVGGVGNSGCGASESVKRPARFLGAAPPRLGGSLAPLPQALLRCKKQQRLSAPPVAGRGRRYAHCHLSVREVRLRLHVVLHRSLEGLVHLAPRTLIRVCVLK